MNMPNPPDTFPPGHLFCNGGTPSRRTPSHSARSRRFSRRSGSTHGVSPADSDKTVPLTLAHFHQYLVQPSAARRALDPIEVFSSDGEDEGHRWRRRSKSSVDGRRSRSTQDVGVGRKSPLGEDGDKKPKGRSTTRSDPRHSDFDAPTDSN